MRALIGECRDSALLEWETRISNKRLAGSRVRGMLRERIEDWYMRRHGALTFRITQFLTGHGCFQQYLFNINRARSPLCLHCGLVADTVEHTLEYCHCWMRQRGELIVAFGNDLNMRNIMGVILTDKDKWRIFADFCESVLREKEAMERIMERININPRRSRRRVLEEEE